MTKKLYLRFDMTKLKLGNQIHTIVKVEKKIQKFSTTFFTPLNIVRFKDFLTF